MKKLISKSNTSVLTLLAALTFTGSANAAFISYWFDPTGSNGANAVLVNEFLDYTGAVYVENTYTDATSFNLQQYGYAQVTGRDGVNYMPFSLNEIVASYSGSGTGDLSTGSTTFTDGTLSLFGGGFPAAGNLIAQFDITGGGAQILQLSGAPDGASGLDTIATYFAPGYFFSNDGGVLGADFATFDLSKDFLFGFATNDLSLANNQGTIDLMQGVLNDAFPGNSFSGANVLDADGRLTNLYSGANGQFRMTVDVAEPNILALIGLAFALLGVMTKRQRLSV